MKIIHRQSETDMIQQKQVVTNKFCPTYNRLQVDTIQRVYGNKNEKIQNDIQTIK